MTKSELQSFLSAPGSRRRDILCLIGICLIAVSLMLPIIIRGIPQGNDMPQHFQFAVTIYDSLVAGDLYPAWMENENKGYGGVGMRFYPPVGYYALAIGKMITGDWLIATCFVFCFWMALSATGAYLWCRERSGPGASFLGALAFVAAPYHLNEIYNAFNYAEFAAVAFLPFCFLFADRLARDRKLFNFVGLGTAYALLVLSNLPIAVMGTFALGIYSLASLPRRQFVQTAFTIGGAYLFGAALSMFYWLKVLTEMTWLSHSSDAYSSGSSHYDYRVNFLLQLRYLSDFDEKDMWFANLVLFYTLLMVVPLVVVYRRSARSFADRRLNRVWIVLFFTVLMTTALSTPLWANISLLQKVQFPWRWLSLVSLAGIPLAAAGWKYCMEWAKDKRRPYALLVIGLFSFGVIFALFQVVRPALHQTREEFDTIVSTLRDEKNFDCWLTVWAKESAMANQEKVSTGGREVSDLLWQRKERSFIAAAGEPAKVRLATFYYPYWQVLVNGAKVEAAPADDGAITFDIPAQESHVDVRFVEPLMLPIARYGSLTLWLFALIVLVGGRLRKILGARDNSSPRLKDEPAPVMG